MATKVTMEALSPTMEEGRLVKWLKNEGDAIAKGDVLAEVETDKAVMELTARGDGVLRARLATEGDTRPVGELLAVIGAKDENIDALLAKVPAKALKASEAEAPPAPPASASPPAAPAAPAAPATQAPSAPSPAAAPMATA
ncbi:MAG: lipoyl domain-containing protein, partial [Gemmatimonadota bacterium]|nr:lipoyl domain-containing protein [Gemmatimonadota bacterium]